MIEQPNKKVPNYIWNGNYPTWDAAEEAAKAIGTEGMGGD
jgi:hypothetical protein